MKDYSCFTGLYPLTKTIELKAVPQGNTLKYIKKDLLTDKKRAEAYKTLKPVIEAIDRDVISGILKDLQKKPVPELLTYYALWAKKGRTNEENASLRTLQAALRARYINEIDSTMSNAGLFEKDLFLNMLPAMLERKDDHDAAEALALFDGFTSSGYIKQYNTNRENMYSNEKSSNSIPRRIVDDNIPRCFANHNAFKIISSKLGDELLKVEEEMQETEVLGGVSLDSWFSIEAAGSYLSQASIDAYNEVVGGRSDEIRSKVKGLNEYINEYNQKHSKDKGFTKLPLLKKLYKQILSESSGYRFSVVEVENAYELLNTIGSLKTLLDTGYPDAVNFMEKHIRQTPALLRIQSRNLTKISQFALGDYRAIKNYLKEMNFPNCEYYSLQDLMTACVNDDKDITAAIISGLHQHLNEYTLASSCLAAEIARIGKIETLSFDDETARIIESYMNAAKSLQTAILLFETDSADGDRDESFYAEYERITDSIAPLFGVYNTTRNFVSKKPWRKKKTRVMFGSPKFLDGWAESKEADNGMVLLIRDGKYYLLVANKENKKLLKHIPLAAPGEEIYDKLFYNQLPDPKRDLPKTAFSRKHNSVFCPTENEIAMHQWDKENKKKGKNREPVPRECTDTLINYYKRCISLNPGWSVYNFSFKPTEEYETVPAFLDDVDKQSYSMLFKPISKPYIDSMVEQGRFFLFELTCRDFSEKSKGKHNLNARYFEELFSEENLRTHKIWLNGSAKMFFREKSVPYKATHPANAPIRRRHLTQEEEMKGLTLDDVYSIFPYDIAKDRHFTEDVFTIQLPLTFNYLADCSTTINEQVVEMLKRGQIKHAIGIDRGERNLITVAVVDMEGNVIESRSMNIINDVDYQKLLAQRSNERQDQRRTWQTVESIKNLKKGYVSQAVKEICRMAIKYNAIIVLEDLNRKFMEHRSAVEVEVYRQFENALLSKLNYYVDKDVDRASGPLAPGGVLNGLQLTPQMKNVRKKEKQLGIVFFVPAWNTSKIDPATAFANLFRAAYLRYQSVKASKDFFEKMMEIRCASGCIEFIFDYKDFDNLTTTPPDNYPVWTLRADCKRIISVKGSNHTRNEEVELNDCFLSLLTEYEIDLDAEDIKPQIMAIEDAMFWEAFHSNFRLLLQLRNSDSNGNDYISSPVVSFGKMFCTGNGCIIGDADENGAVNIARKGIMMITAICKAFDLELSSAAKRKFIDEAISDTSWLSYGVENPLKV